MRRTLSTFVTLFVLVLNILNSKASSKNIKRIQILALSPTDNTLKSKSQPMSTKINNLLIYPTPIAFKYQILPFLSSEHIIKIYEYLKSLYPQLDLSKWLESFNTNVVLTLEESKILYWVSSSNPILYSPKNKSAIITQNFHPNILPEVHCALLPSKKIVPFQSQTLLSFDEAFMVAENSDEDEFFIIDKSFGIVAYGNVSETEFYNYKDYIFEAQNLKGSKKCFLKMKYFVLLPFVKYLKCISPFCKSWINFTQKTDVWLESNVNNILDYFENSDRNCLTILVLYVFIFWLLIELVIHLPMNIALYHIIMFPFHILALPGTICLFNFVSFCGFPISLFFGYSYFFPNFIDDFLTEIWFRYKEFFIFPSTSSFEIQPQNKMKFLSFLIPRKIDCFFYVVTLIYGVFSTLIFKPFIENWV